MTLTPECVAITEQGLSTARLGKEFCKASEIVRLKDERLLAAVTDLLAACKAAVEQLRFYDGLVTVKNHDAELIGQLEAAIAKTEEQDTC